MEKKDVIAVMASILFASDVDRPEETAINIYEKISRLLIDRKIRKNNP